MEDQWRVDRARLRQLHQTFPNLSIAQLCQATGYSRSWVKKWLARFALDPENDILLRSLSTRPRRTRPRKPFAQLLVDRVLDLRDHLPQTLHRIPGPRTILYYLKKDHSLSGGGLKIPNSTTPIWRILRDNGRISKPKLRGPHKPVPRPVGLHHWQIDFKDAGVQKIEPGGKKQHLVEILNGVDVGTSIHLAGLVSENFNSKTALMALVEMLKKWGKPDTITFDRDPRWVGSHSGRDYPTAFVRMLCCLGITPTICPPHRPDLNGFVERFHRSLKGECLKAFKPQDVGAVRECVDNYSHFYNHERPHQGESCQDQPPYVAFPVLPLLPDLPMWVNPDRWLKVIHKHQYRRKVKATGSFEPGCRFYYLGQQWAGYYLTLEIDALNREVVVKRLPSQTPRAKKGKKGQQAEAGGTETASPTSSSSAAPAREVGPEQPPVNVPQPSANGNGTEEAKILSGGQGFSKELVEITRLPLKGLYEVGEISLEKYLSLLEDEASNEQ